MYFSEVTTLLKEGKKVKRSDWYQNDFIFFDNNKNSYVTNSRSNMDSMIPNYLLENRDNWEEYIELKKKPKLHSFEEALELLKKGKIIYQLQGHYRYGLLNNDKCIWINSRCSTFWSKINEESAFTSNILTNDWVIEVDLLYI